jgi:hypothetical protein
MCKSEKIWVACGTNVIEMLQAFQSHCLYGGVISTYHHCQQDEQHSKASSNKVPTKN